MRRAFTVKVDKVARRRQTFPSPHPPFLEFLPKTASTQSVGRRVVAMPNLLGHQTVFLTCCRKMPTLSFAPCVAWRWNLYPMESQIQSLMNFDPNCYRCNFSFQWYRVPDQFSDNIPSSCRWFVSASASPWAATEHPVSQKWPSYRSPSSSLFWTILKPSWRSKSKWVDLETI